MMRQMSTNSSHHFKYKFVSIEKRPNSLVILKNEMDYVRPNFWLPQIVWIDELQNLQVRQFLLSRIPIPIAYYNIVSSVQKSLKIGHNIIIVTSIKFCVQIQKLYASNDLIKLIICYSNNLSLYKQYKQTKKIGSKFKQCLQHPESLVKCLMQNIYKVCQNKQHTNFISLNKQIHKSNLIMKCIGIITNQETNKAQMIKQLMHFLFLVKPYQGKRLQEIQTILLQSAHNSNNLIGLVQNSINIRFIINQILKSAQSPIDLLILQPYLKVYFGLILQNYKSKSKSDRANKNVNSRRFYLQAYLSTKEVSMIKSQMGNIIQNMGFLYAQTRAPSTNYSQSNVLFIIDVSNQQRNQEIDFGFAQINSLIIFNPLNSFKIIGVQQNQNGNKFYLINLKYGELARLLSNRNQIFNQKQKNYILIAKNLMGSLKNYKFMGQVLMDGTISMQGSLQYYQCYSSMALQSKSKQQMAHGYCMLGKVLFNINNNEQAKKCFQLARKIREGALNGQKHIGYATILQNLASLYVKSQQYQKAQQLLNQVIQIKKDILVYNHESILISLNSLGQLYYRQANYQKSLQVFQQCLKTNENRTCVVLATILGNIGSTYRRMKLNAKAQQFYQKCKQIQQITIGRAHPDYTKNLDNLIVLYGQSNNLKKVEQIRKQYVQIQESSRNNDSD